MKSLSNNACILVITIGLVLSLLSSCIKDKINMDKISNAVDWPVAYGTPVAYGSLSLGDIVSAFDNQALVKEDNTGLLYLLYRDNVFSETADNLLTIPTQMFSQSFKPLDKGFSVGTGLDSVKFSRDTSFVFSFNKSDVEIDSIIFKSGYLSVHSSIDIPFVCRVDVTFPTFKNNGVPLKIPIRKNTTAATFTDDTSPVDIHDYKLQFTKNATSSNIIPVHYDVVVKNNKSNINTSQSISSSVFITSAGFSSIYGYLGQIPDLLNLLNQKITLDFFDNTNNYNVEVSNPTINMYIRNSFGVPVQLQLGNTRTYSDKTSTDFPIVITSPSPSVKDIKYPKITEVGKTIYDTIQIVSNIFDAIKTSPHYFYYTEKAIANPLGKTTSSNFFTDSSKVNIDMEIKLPFNLKAGNLEATDTVPFDMGSVVSDFSIVKKIAIYNTYTNSIPFDLKLQVFLIDDNKGRIDSLYTIANQPVVRSGVPISNTNPVKYTFSQANTFGVFFDEARAKKLEKVKQAVLKVSMTTAGNGQNYVQFFANYRLNCAFQVKTELYVTSLNQL